MPLTTITDLQGLGYEHHWDESGGVHTRRCLVTSRFEAADEAPAPVSEGDGENFE
jgi:hypothetical protein